MCVCEFLTPGVIYKDLIYSKKCSMQNAKCFIKENLENKYLFVL